MKSLFVIFCFALGAPAFARIDHHALTLDEQTELESALDVIASYQEIPAHKMWFNKTFYRASNNIWFGSLGVEYGARASRYLVRRYFSNVTGRVIETFRLGLNGAVAVGSVVGTVSGLIFVGELVSSFVDGYRGIPDLTEKGPVESLMGTPQGYQRVIAMAKDPSRRETLREYATGDSRFYAFLLNFGRTPTK